MALPLVLLRTGKVLQGSHRHLRQSLARSWWLLQLFYVSVPSFQFGEHRILSNGVLRKVLGAELLFRFAFWCWKMFLFKKKSYSLKM